MMFPNFKISMTATQAFPSNVKEYGLPATFSRRTFLTASGYYLVLQAAQPRTNWLFASSNSAESNALPRCFESSRTAYPPLLERFIEKLDPAADIFPTEVYVLELEKLLTGWSAALCRSVHDTKVISGDLSGNLVASSLRASETITLRASLPLHIERRSFRGAETTEREGFLSSLAMYVAPYTALHLAEFEIYAIRIASQLPLRVETEIHYDLVGLGTDGTKEQRVGSWSISWQKENSGRWIAERWIANSEVRSRLTGPGFTEITAQCLEAGAPAMTQLQPGIDEWRTTLDAASGIDVYGNHGVAVGDLDGSGFDSFYVCQPSGLPNRLFRNRGDGTFEDITERSGVGVLDGTASALFVDFCNRGKQDLLVIRSGGPLLFTNMGDGRFEVKPDAFHFARPPQGTFTSAAVADYNRDGFLDVYFCVYSYYQGLNQYQFPSPYYDAQNGPPNFLFRNRGDGTFEDVTVASGVDQNNNRFSFAVEWCDYNNNGWPDLYVANDFGRKNLYRNNGDGTFTDIAAQAGVEDYGPGMSTCWVDYDNDGRQDLYVANMWLPEGKRITADEHFLPDVAPEIRALYRKHNAGNSFYRNNSNGAFEDKSIEAGTAKGGWSWSCSSWDFDNDGYADLYVANGFVSGKNHFDLQSFFWRQVAQRSANSPGKSPEYEMAWNAVNELVRSDYSWSGYQRNVFFANNHDGTFSDVSGALGLDLRDDSRAYALSDFDHDGRLEFVLKNRTGPQLRILRNDLEGIGNSVVFRLTGHKSNHDAIGAVVTIVAGAIRQTKFVSAGSGFASQHTKELFFGVGEGAQPITISVRWPSGTIDRYENISINHRVEIEEGKQEFKSTPYQVPRSKSRLQAAEMKAPPTSPEVSTWLIAPLFGPDVKLPDLQGTTHQLSALRGRVVLLTFVRLDCGDGQRQLEELQKASATLASAGITAMAVIVNNSADQTQAQEFANSSRSSFPILVADEHVVAVWNIQYRYLFDRRRDMNFPTSFLIDKSGATIRVYHGFATPQSVVDDWESAPTTPEKKFARAMPFPGHYYGNAMKRDYFTYGVAFVEYGYLDEAQAALQRVVDTEPSYAAAWFNLGTIYLGKKVYPEAQRCLREAVRLNPEDSDAWNNLGMIAGEQEKYDEALEDFRQSARANPNHPQAVQNMMSIYQFQARPADAQKALEELIARAPENAGLHLALAMALLGQDQVAHGREELETAVRLRPDYVDALNNLGTVLLQTGHPQDALQQFERCRRLAPDLDRPVINSAIVYNRTGQPAKAREILEEFMTRHPDNVEARGAYEKMVAR
jgi:tetratricopeptide (TPR) repeat protein